MLRSLHIWPVKERQDGIPSTGVGISSTTMAESVAAIEERQKMGEANGGKEYGDEADIGKD
jgi:hypothetical protein